MGWISLPIRIWWIPIQSIGLKWLQIDIESIGIGSDIIEHVNKSMKRRANDELAEC